MKQLLFFLLFIPTLSFASKDALSPHPIHFSNLGEPAQTIVPTSKGPLLVVWDGNSLSLKKPDDDEEETLFDHWQDNGSQNFSSPPPNYGLGCLFAVLFAVYFWFGIYVAFSKGIIDALLYFCLSIGFALTAYIAYIWVKGGRQ